MRLSATWKVITIIIIIDLVSRNLIVKLNERLIKTVWPIWHSKHKSLNSICIRREIGQKKKNGMDESFIQRDALVTYFIHDGWWAIGRDHVRGGGIVKDQINQSPTEKGTFLAHQDILIIKKKAKINSGLLVEPKSSWLRREKGSGRADGRTDAYPLSVFFLILYQSSIVDISIG